MHLHKPSLQELADAQVDITEPEHGVDVATNHDNTVLWVNVDGVCILRVCRCPVIIINNGIRLGS